MSTMAAVQDELVMMPEMAAARLAGVSQRQLRYWHENGLLTPGIYRELSPRNRVRLYEFRDLLELLVISELQQAGLVTLVIRRIVEHLRERGYERPLTELVFAVEGRQVFFQHPDGTWEGGRKPDQVVLHQVLKLEPLMTRIRRAVEPTRDPDLAGRIAKRRGVLGSKPTFEGTRTPVEVVVGYLERGLSTERILQAFPHLSDADVEAARRTMTAA